MPALAAVARNTNAAVSPRTRRLKAPRRDDCSDELANASNAALALIDAGKLDEAEQAAHELLKRFPGAHDGYARLGLVYEVRGANRQAIDYYQKVIAFARKRPSIYNSEFTQGYQALIDRLQQAIAD